LTAAISGFSRLFLLFYWLARPVQVDAAFGGFILPCVGFVILPFATLMYVMLWQAGGLQGLDWLWVILAAVLDIIGLGSAGYSNRNYIPGYSGSTQTPNL
jgi:hypothetical protein